MNRKRLETGIQLVDLWSLAYSVAVFCQIAKACGPQEEQQEEHICFHPTSTSLFALARISTDMPRPACCKTCLCIFACEHRCHASSNRGKVWQFENFWQSPHGPAMAASRAICASPMSFPPAVPGNSAADAGNSVGRRPSRA